MPRRKRVPSAVVDLDDERILQWRYERLTRPLAIDPPEASAVIVDRIARERDRLDRTRRPLADRLAALCPVRDRPRIPEPGAARDGVLAA